MRSLTITTCQAQNTVEPIAALAGFLGKQLGLVIDVVALPGWQDRYAAVRSARIDLAWICGWPYVQFVDCGLARVELLAGAVYAAPRYARSPRYFADVIVGADSQFRSISDLRGGIFAVNDADSLSGYHSMKAALISTGYVGDESSGFFRHVKTSGGHVRSIRMIAQGDADAASIDSTLYAWQCEQTPALRSRVRVLESIGPFPIPPLVVQRSLPEQLKRDLRQALIAMHFTKGGREILAQCAISRFAHIEDRHYDSVRQLAKRTAHCRLGPVGPDSL